MNSSIAAFLDGLTGEELKVLGALLHRQSLNRIWCFYEGAQAARDTQPQGELFSDPRIDHSFSNFVEDVGSLREAMEHPGEALFPEPRLLSRMREQLQAELGNRDRREGQMA